MKMNKILLSVALLVSVSAFAMDTAQIAPIVQTSLVARAKKAASKLFVSGYKKVSDKANYAWENRPGMPKSVTEKFATCSKWTSSKAQALSKWVTPYIPVVKTFVTNPRNLKIAGATAAVVAAVTGSYYFARKLFVAKPVAK